MPSIERDYRDLLDALPSPRRLLVIAVAGCLGTGILAGAGAWALERYGAAELARASEPTPVVASGVLLAEPHPMVVQPGPKGTAAVMLLSLDDDIARWVKALSGTPVRVTGVPVQGAQRPLLALRGEGAIRSERIASFAQLVAESEARDEGPATVRGELVLPGGERIAGAGLWSVPPMLESRDASGQVCYYLLAGQDGRPLHTSGAFPPGELELGGRVERIGDLRILRVDPPAGPPASAGNSGG